MSFREFGESRIGEEEVQQPCGPDPLFSIRNRKFPHQIGATGGQLAATRGQPEAKLRTVSSVSIPRLILCFHGVGVPPTRVPEEERPYWISEVHFRNFVSSVKTQEQASRVSVILTFDDGNRSDRYIAAPILSEHGIPALFFPCVGRLGRPGYLDVEDLRSLRNQGYEIGSHGVNHVRWSGLDEGTLRKEVSGSKDVLAAALDSEITAASIPFGAYNRRVLSAIRDSGYSTVYSSDRGLTEVSSWMCRRWTYRADRPFDIGHLVTVSRSITRRLYTRTTQFAKALR